MIYQRVTNFLIAISCGICLQIHVAAQSPEDESAPVDTPAVLTIKESNPQTATDIARAADLMIKLDRVDLALIYLKQLLDNPPAKEDWVTAQRRLGSGLFIRLQRLPELQPLGTQVAQMAMKAVAEDSQDQARIDQLVKDLASADSLTRQKAIAELKRSQSAAINPLLNLLSQSNESQQQNIVRNLLIEMDEDAEGAMLAAILSDDPALQLNVISLLEKMNSKSLIDLIISLSVNPDADPQVQQLTQKIINQQIGSTPNLEQAKLYLSKRIADYTSGKAMFFTDENGQATLWVWDQTSKQSKQQTLLAQDAAILRASQLAKQLYELDSENSAARRDYFITALQAEKFLSGLDTPITGSPIGKELSDQGNQVISELLAYTLSRPQFRAATLAACELLGQGKADMLQGESGEPHPLVQAVNHSNYRVKFAAVKSIMQLDPQSPYPGSAAVADALIFLATAANRRIIVIAEPHLERAEILAGKCLELGFETQVSRGGRSLFLDAHASPDVEMIFLSDAVNRPVDLESIQILRRDRRSGEIPIGFISAIENLERNELRVADDPRTIAMIRPYDRNGLTFRIQQLLKTQGRFLVDANTRFFNGQQAIQHLNLLASDDEKYSFYRLLEREKKLLHFLDQAALTNSMAPLVGNFGTAKSQTALIDLASDPYRSIETREACIEGFATAVKKRGLMLTKSQILVQYDRYNASETLNKETQQLLSEVLDIIENKADKN